MTDKEADSLIDRLEADVEGASYESHLLAQPLREYVAELRSIADALSEYVYGDAGGGMMECNCCAGEPHPDQDEIEHIPTCPVSRRNRQREE